MRACCAAKENEGGIYKGFQHLRSYNIASSSMVKKNHLLDENLRFTDIKCVAKKFPFLNFSSSRYLCSSGLEILKFLSVPHIVMGVLCGVETRIVKF